MRPDLSSRDDVPPFWWGPAWAPRTSVGLGELITSGLLPLDLAALLWDAIEDGASIVTAAGPSGAGKTTLTTALLDFLPAAKRRFYARGMYETFAFEAEETPDRVAILVNEISPHLPVYLWGDGVRRLLALHARGYQFLATCHAESVEELVYSLCSYPLRLNAADLNAFDIVIFLRAWQEGGTVRRLIDRVVSLRAGEGRGLTAVLLFENGRLHLSGVAEAFGWDEMRLDAFETEHDRRVAELWTRFGG